MVSDPSRSAINNLYTELAIFTGGITVRLEQRMAGRRLKTSKASARNWDLFPHSVVVGSFLVIISSSEQSREQLRYNWVPAVLRMRTVRKTRLAVFLRKSKFPVKTA